MPETITLHALDLSGETTLKLFLRKDDGTLLNTGGDDLAEIATSGVFQATLTESRVGLGTLNARVCDAVETADGLLIDDALPESSTVIGAKVKAELDSDVAAKIDDIHDAAGWLLAIHSGACANPQTSTEQYDITQFGVNYRVVMAGQTSTGTRTAPTLSKP